MIIKIILSLHPYCNYLTQGELPSAALSLNNIDLTMIHNYTLLYDLHPLKSTVIVRMPFKNGCWVMIHVLWFRFALRPSSLVIKEKVLASAQFHILQIMAAL